MAKAKKTTEPVVTPVEVTKTFMDDLSKEELLTRYEANKIERQRLADENKMLIVLYKGATSTAKKTSAEAKIAALTAKLEALKGASVPELPADTPAETIAA
jgi:hypothetical protein